LRTTFLSINTDVVSKVWSYYCGTTALVALILNNKLYIANAGDTRAVLCRGDKAIRLSFDHKPNEKEETDRIIAAGGTVKGKRVNGMLAVSRAIGDAFLQPYVTADPYISDTDITPEDKFLILACDGLWDVFTDDAAVTEILHEKDAQQAAETLKNAAYELGSLDNISVIVVLLHNSTIQDIKST